MSARSDNDTNLMLRTLLTHLVAIGNYNNINQVSARNRKMPPLSPLPPPRPKSCSKLVQTITAKVAITK